MEFWYLAAIVGAVATIYLLRRAADAYIGFQKLQNRLLDIAFAEFREQVEVLLRRPEDLPLEVLELAGMMSDVALLPKSERALFKAIQWAGSPDPEGSDLAAINTLSPAARDAFFRATAAWLTIMANKSTFSGLRIMYAQSKAEEASGRLIDPSQAALPVMRGLAGTARRASAS